MFSSLFSVCLSVCLLATLCKTLRMIVPYVAADVCDLVGQFSAFIAFKLYSIA